MDKRADDYAFPMGLSATMSAPQMHVGPGIEGQRLLALRADAEELTQQLRAHEEMRMSQAVENLGGPGSMRARYMRAVMTNPYAVSPLLPYMQHGMMGQLPPGAGAVHSMPTELDLRAGEPDPEMTALEQGITHTAAAKIAQAMGRVLAKTAEDYAGFGPPAHVRQESYQPYYPPQPPYIPQSDYGEPEYAQEPPQEDRYMRAVQPPKGGGGIAKHVGNALQSAGSAIGKGVLGFMNQDTQGSRRWGSGATPAASTNEYGQPLYG
jgi:hypothetical protein